MKWLEDMGFILNEHQTKAFLNHLDELEKRLENQEKLNLILEPTIKRQVSTTSMQLAKKFLDSQFKTQLAEIEYFLVATYIEMAKEKKVGNKIVIIGHRMGKGQNVAQGLEKSGMQAYVIEGMGADMKLGDIMHEKNAKYGISFCGSGGAGAITASNKYGYKQKSSLRTVADGVGAILNGANVVGFGFMDTEELGEELGKAWRKRDF